MMGLCFENDFILRRIYAIFDIDFRCMDIQAEKLNLIKWLTDVNEPSIIKRFIALKQEQQIDWWDKISDEEKAEIEEGLAQADNGEVVSHETVMAKYQQWRSK